MLHTHLFHYSLVPQKLVPGSGFETPQERIRRGISTIQAPSHDKVSQPGKVKRPQKKKLKSKSRKPAVPALPNGNIAEGTEAPAPMVAPRGTCTAAKSAPAPKAVTQIQPPLPKTEVPTPPPTPPAVKEPNSAARESAFQQVQNENLRRADTANQVPTTPAPSATAPPEVPAATPASDTDSDESDDERQSVAPSVAPTVTPPTDPPAPAGAPVVAPAPGRKKRRAKTLEEKAIHARFMRFTRHIQSI